MRAIIYMDKVGYKTAVVGNACSTFFPGETMERALTYCWAMGATRMKVKVVSIKKRANISMKINNKR